MNVIHDNIWNLVESHYIVIPTNIGWKANGANVMGRGLAHDAARRYLGLPEWYGVRCKEHRNALTVIFYAAGSSGLLLFPVKRLNEKEPWLSWKSAADIGRITQSTRQLAMVMDEGIFGVSRERRVAVPMVGCGNGGLLPNVVRPVLEEHLSKGPFDLVLQGA
jgi:hypothetical protein